jgi:hypothetical protein
MRAAIRALDPILTGIVRKQLLRRADGRRIPVSISGFHVFGLAPPNVCTLLHGVVIAILDRHILRANPHKVSMFATFGDAHPGAGAQG